MYVDYLDNLKRHSEGNDQIAFNIYSFLPGIYKLIFVSAKTWVENDNIDMIYRRQECTKV